MLKNMFFSKSQWLTLCLEFTNNGYHDIQPGHYSVTAKALQKFRR